MERETEADAAEAANGLEVWVRYITRAPQGNAVLFQVIVDVLHKGA